MRRDDLYGFMAVESPCPYHVSSRMSNFTLDEGNVTFSDLHKEPLLRHPIPIIVVLTLAYSLVFVLGVIGNILVVSVVWRGPGMRSPTNLFIANLACADLLVIFICLPFTLFSNVLVEWKFGWFVCKTIPYMQGVSVNASINTLVAISVERCTSICRPLKGKITTSTVKLAVITIWVISFTITLPWALVFQLQPISNTQPLIGCLETWPSPYSDRWYFIIVNLIMCYLLPLCIITVCYLLIWRRVCCRQLPGEPQASGQLIIQRSKVKVIKMLLVVIVLFAFSWLPFYIVFTRIKLGPSLDPHNTEDDIIYSMIPVSQWLGSSNSCINPILYAFFNKKFRTGFKAILRTGSWWTPIAQSRRLPKHPARKTIASHTPRAVQISDSSNPRSISLRTTTTNITEIKLSKTATFV